jgi:hypothetical protein
MPVPGQPEQQADEKGRLVEALRPRAEELLQQVAQLLAANPGAAAFGATEFQLRDLLLAGGADFLEAALAEKKTATRARRSPAPAANRLPTSTPIAPATTSSACSAPSACGALTTTAAAAAKATSPSTSRPA